MIRFENIGVSFGAKRLFRGFNLDVAAGERIALTGESGTGKSTVLGCLLGFVSPDEGTIEVEGTRLSPSTVWAIRRRIAYVPQEADLGDGTVGTFLQRPFQYAANHSLRDNLQRAPALFAALGLKPGLETAVVASLSGGEKQRVALASALLLDRPILVMDEVTSALDRQSAERVAELLLQQQGLTMLGVVHEGSRMPFATRVVEVGHDH